MESLVLNKDNVKLKVKASDWEEAVRIGAGMLENKDVQNNLMLMVSLLLSKN